MFVFIELYFFGIKVAPYFIIWPTNYIYALICDTKNQNEIEF